MDLARSELNSLLDKAARIDDGDGEPDPDSDLYHRYSLDQLSDAELEAEIERRRKARESGARTAKAAPDGAPKARPAQSTRSAPPPRRPAAPPDEVRQAYAALEVPYGSDFATVRKSYRALMRKYHPDRHTQSPDKQKTANELAQKLTLSYKLLEKKLRK